jgi:hypothetical protein
LGKESINQRADEIIAMPYGTKYTYSQDIPMYMRYVESADVFKRIRARKNLRSVHGVLVKGRYLAVGLTLTPERKSNLCY